MDSKRILLALITAGLLASIFFMSGCGEGIMDNVVVIPPVAGIVDKTLSDGTHEGFVVYDSGSQGGGYSILGLSDGAFLAIGYGKYTNNDMIIRKYNQYGSLEASFGTAGQVTYDRGPNDYPAAALIDPAGKILITGYSSNATDADMIIWRYNADGTPDTTFGTGGTVIFNSGKDDFGSAITLESNGNIFVAGSIYNATNGDLALWEFDTNGSPVASFGLNGRAIYPTGDPSFGNDIKITADGIYVAGSTGQWGSTRGIIVRFDKTGNADASFGTGGKVLTSGGGNDEFNAMGIDPNGRIVLAGRSGSDMALWRYKSDGTSDISFGNGGKQIYSNGTFNTLLFDSSGRILVAGGNSVGFTDSRFVVARYNQNGSLDTTFGTNGLAVLDNGKMGDANDMAFDSFGRLLLIGTTYYANPDFMVCRFK